MWVNLCCFQFVHTRSPQVVDFWPYKFYSAMIMNQGEVKFGWWWLVVTRPLPRDGGMAEYHGAPEAGQLLRVWTRGRTETESRQRVSGAKSP